MLDSDRLADRPGKTYSLGPARILARSRISTERSTSGTRWDLPAFIRDAGMVQIFFSKSISSQLAPRTLARPASGEDEELKGKLGDLAKITLGHCPEEVWYLSERHRGVVANLVGLLGKAPCHAVDRVLPRPEPCSFRPVEHALDALSDATRGLRLRQPNRR